jgi:hypothetical protein
MSHLHSSLEVSMLAEAYRGVQNQRMPMDTLEAREPAKNMGLIK